MQNNPVNRIDPVGLQQSIPLRLPWWTPFPITLPAFGPVIPIVIGIGIVLWPSEIAEEPPCDRWREQCINLYVKCKDENWVGPCGMCLNKCTAQHEWDFNMCHPKKRCD